MHKFSLFLAALFLFLMGCSSPETSKENHVRIFIVHGYGASTTDHWFPWLKQEMEKKGAKVSIIDLPTPKDPKTNEWEQSLRDQAQPVDKNTYFVAHSLGSITLLRFLEEKHPAEIGGYILVSGFNENLPALPQLNTFIEPNIHYAELIRITKNRTVISAKDDAIVPSNLSRNLADSLNAKFIETNHGGHFLGEEGYTRFPLVLEELQKQIDARQ